MSIINKTGTEFLTPHWSITPQYYCASMEVRPSNCCLVSIQSILPPPTSFHFNMYQWDGAKLHASSHWDDIKNQRSFMDNLAKKLQITDHEGWYKITNSVLRKNGAALLYKYNGSPFKLLSAVYPEYPLFTSHHNSLHMYQWDRTKFCLYKGHWDSIHNQRAFFDDVAKKLRIFLPHFRG